MSVINSIPLIAAGDDGYQISRSVRLRSSASAYFNRTPASAGNRKTWTWSGWVKRGALGSTQDIFSQYSGSVSDFEKINIRFSSSDKISIDAYSFNFLVSTQVFRDPSAWYHIVFAFDTTQATANNRVRLYVNGTEVTAFDTRNNPSLNTDYGVNMANTHRIGSNSVSLGVYLDGYLTEVNFIDGQALTPSSFGETDVLTGVWKPKKYAGTYGTNGFYLNFSDNSAATAAAIGKDNSGNGNNWTPNNISVTAGATYDSMLDVPTMWADGGNGRGNYCTLNPLATQSTAVTLSNANLTMTLVASGNAIYYGTIGAAANAYYFETTITNLVAGGDGYVGIYDSANNSAFANCVYRADGTIFNGSGFSAYGASYTTGDVIGVAYDLTNNTITFYKNNVSQGQKTIVSGKTVIPAAYISYSSSGTVWSLNFGQRPFAYTPPTGFKALNTQNLPDATIKKGGSYFNTVLYTGNAGSQSITGVGFQPDFVWGKLRSTSSYHRLHDAVRGADNTLATNVTDAEVSGNGLVSFDADGFTMDSGTNINQAYTYVAWNWKESASAGFDIVTYTGNGAASRTVAHGLGVAPSMIIFKGRSTVNDWPVYHASVGNTAALLLNRTDAISTSALWWNNTSPTSSVFSLGNIGSALNQNAATYVAYLFAEVAGFSKFGSYTGNGSADGPFVYCGFRPRYVLIKKSSAAGDSWFAFDSSRDAYNVATKWLAPNISNAEGGDTFCDFVSNGFKVRGSISAFNASGATFVYAAFAENPFKNSLAR